MWIHGSRSGPPASSSITLCLPSALSRFASTQPAEPAPTMTKSTSAESSTALLPSDLRASMSRAGVARERRHEGGGPCVAHRKRAVLLLVDDREHLALAGNSERQHHAPAGLELRDQRWRNLRRRGGDDDRVERRFLRPAAMAVAELE